MTVVRIHQQHTIDHLQRQVVDAASIVGETCFILTMYNSQNAQDIARCSYCYSDVYGQSDTTSGICTHCFGTTYENGIKQSTKSNIIVGAPSTTSQYDKNTGEWEKTTVSAQLPANIQLHEKDYICAVKNTYTGVNRKPLDYFVCYKVWKVMSSTTDVFVKDGLRSVNMWHQIGTTCTLIEIEDSLFLQCEFNSAGQIVKHSWQ